MRAASKPLWLLSSHMDKSEEKRLQRQVPLDCHTEATVGVRGAPALSRGPHGGMRRSQHCMVGMCGLLLRSWP